MNARAGLFALSALFVSGAAWADGGTSCATAQELFPGTSYSGDTSTSTNFVGAFGGLPSPGPDLAFKFTYGPGMTDGPIHVTITGGWNAGAVVTASCGGNGGNPISANTGTGAFDVQLSTLTFGTLYYFYMTGNPSDNSGPSGAFAFIVPTPVTLQSFSVE